jgi:hypothetical protein
MGLTKDLGARKKLAFKFCKLQKAMAQESHGRILQQHA